MKTLATICLALLTLGLIAGPAPAQQGKPEPADPSMVERFRTKPEAEAEAETALEQVAAYIEQMKADGKIDTGQEGWKMKLPRFPEVEFEAGATYYWNLKTSLGEMKIHFLPGVAPLHVANFLYLTELGFFDGLIFHRVITGFMAQGGCPTGTGFNGPGYGFGGEFDPEVKHDTRGILSMAHSAKPNSDGSQFFLVFNATPWLDGKHTIFGEMVKGDETLDALERRGSRSGKTTEKIEIQKAWITQD